MAHAHTDVLHLHATATDTLLNGLPPEEKTPFIHDPGPSGRIATAMESKNRTFHNAAHAANMAGITQQDADAMLDAPAVAPHVLTDASQRETVTVLTQMAMLYHDVVYTAPDGGVVTTYADQIDEAIYGNHPAVAILNRIFGVDGPPRELRDNGRVTGYPPGFNEYYSALACAVENWEMLALKGPQHAEASVAIMAAAIEGTIPFRSNDPQTGHFNQLRDRLFDTLQHVGLNSQDSAELTNTAMMLATNRANHDVIGFIGGKPIENPSLYHQGFAALDIPLSASGALTAKGMRELSARFPELRDIDPALHQALADDMYHRAAHCIDGSFRLMPETNGSYRGRNDDMTAAGYAASLEGSRKFYDMLSKPSDSPAPSVDKLYHQVDLIDANGRPVGVRYPASLENEMAVAQFMLGAVTQDYYLAKETALHMVAAVAPDTSMHHVFQENYGQKLANAYPFIFGYQDAASTDGIPPRINTLHEIATFRLLRDGRQGHVGFDIDNSPAGAVIYGTYGNDGIASVRQWAASAEGQDDIRATAAWQKSHGKPDQEFIAPEITPTAPGQMPDAVVIPVSMTPALTIARAVQGVMIQ